MAKRQGVAKKLETRKAKRGAAPSLQSRHFVYAIENTAHHVKIGHTADVQSRMAGIKTGSSTALRLYGSWGSTRTGAMECELLAHRLLDEARLSGEWFDISPCEAADVIEAILAGDEDGAVDVAEDAMTRLSIRQELVVARRAVRTLYAAKNVAELPFARWGVEALKAELRGEDYPPVPAGFEDRVA